MSEIKSIVRRFRAALYRNGGNVREKDWKVPKINHDWSFATVFTTLLAAPFHLIRRCRISGFLKRTSLQDKRAGKK